MSFQIPMGELVHEVQSMRKEAAEWDPTGNIEWDITVYVIATDSWMEYQGPAYFLDINKGKKMRDHINSQYPDANPAKLLKVVVKLNREKK